MVVSSGGGLGRVLLTLRSSELCCRAASWRKKERQREKGGVGVGEQPNMGRQGCMDKKGLEK